MTATTQAVSRSLHQVEQFNFPLTKFVTASHFTQAKIKQIRYFVG